ncbi:ORMDL family-domain-containing protein [Dactylonectria estremocensis]|uniref:ORMDL family-domain-containing protein n=1 Tax=Dactylonectria estremocensis TaxID=1079267 RepID=A0A9P9J9K8_9HYPO|nr:ORMDL family-domain-containing protein [Dactylonectria estremocensis]
MPERNAGGARRRRSSSILQVYHEPPETLEQISDQAALPNLNANWTNAKGAWTIHFVLIACLKIFYDIIPGVSQETSWTLVNMTYMFGSYIMFHYVRGVPFEFNSGAFDNLNMWEQIDNGAQYTPTKKFLLSVPIMLFLLSTHYTHYDLAYFIINFLAVLAVVIPKLPFVRPPPASPVPLPAALVQYAFCLTEFTRVLHTNISTEPSDAVRTFLWCPGGMSVRLTGILVSSTGVRGVGGFCIWPRKDGGTEKTEWATKTVHINSGHYLLRGLWRKVWSLSGSFEDTFGFR